MGPSNRATARLSPARASLARASLALSMLATALTWAPATAQQNLITDTTTADLSVATGTVQTFDRDGRILTLSDGTRYEIAPSVPLETVRVAEGDPVQVFWHGDGDRRVAAQLVPGAPDPDGAAGSSPAAPLPDGSSGGSGSDGGPAR
ncbi:hypothetical protein [Arenibaculum pallidiluteum]|uniref:hypothetical protein n=1 Tax=Arenibaculum pallidiluteum TaxID=2812559 RepID=UPI001A95C96F|nr:hypothetical protein [Arenibaculum pallidiluteum]